MSRHLLLLDANTPRYDALRQLALARSWSITRAANAEQVTRRFEDQPPDIAIIDPAMAHPHETPFLRTLGERWPAVCLIVIAHNPDGLDQTAPMPASTLHQYVDPQTSTEDIFSLVERNITLQEILSQPALRSVIGGIRQLPAKPRIFTRLQMMLRHEKVTARKISALLAEDSAIAAKVMQLANCVLFHHRGQVKSIEQAVLRLGYSGLSSLVMSAEVLAGWIQVSGQDLDLEAMQAHVQQVVVVTAALMQAGPGSDEAVLAALLHDIGYWILAQEYPDELRRAASLARVEDIPMHEAERMVFGTCHAEVGAYLLGLWGLPFAVVEAVAYHHTPERFPIRRFNTLTALVVALALAGTDDSDAFKTLPRRNGMVGPDFLDRLEGSPFDWSDAARIAAACLSTAELRYGRA